MHPALQQRAAGLNDLQTGAHVATGEFHIPIGKEQSVQPIRYQVVSKGEKAYHIIERSTGKTRGFRFSYKAAINAAQQLEENTCQSAKALK
ncbi:hypothetical protein D9M71_733140 [compost metagenome]